MQINNRKILLIITCITLATVPIVYFSEGAVRICFSLIVLLFFPGYTLLTALFPKRSEFKLNECIALSLGISIAVVPVIGLILHYTPWGLGLHSVFIATTIFILVTAALGWYRAGGFTTREYPSAAKRSSIPGWPQLKKLSKPDKVLTITLAAVLVLFLGVFLYVAFTPNRGENYTEFYILDSQSATDHYPAKIVYGNPVQFTVRVVSHENIPTEYRVEVSIDGTPVSSIETGFLAQNEKWQQMISLIPDHVGDGQKVELWLYKQGESNPYNQNSLHIYLNVNG